MPDYLISTRSQPRQSSNRPSFLAGGRASACVSTHDSKPMWKRSVSVNNSLPLQNPVQQKHQKEGEMICTWPKPPVLSCMWIVFVTLRPKEIDVWTLLARTQIRPKNKTVTATTTNSLYTHTHTQKNRAHSREGGGKTQEKKRRERGSGREEVES